MPTAASEASRTAVGEEHPDTDKIVPGPTASSTNNTMNPNELDFLTFVPNNYVTERLKPTYVQAEIPKLAPPSIFARMTLRTNSQSTDKKPGALRTIPVFQADLHPKIVKTSTEIDRRRYLYLQNNEIPQVYCDNDSYLDIGAVELDDGLLSCYWYIKPNPCFQGTEKKLDASTWLSSSYHQYQHACALTNMTLHNASGLQWLHEIFIAYIDAAQRKTINLSDFLQLSIKYTRLHDELLTHLHFAALESTHHTKYMLRDALLRSASDQDRKFVLGQPTFQKDVLYQSTDPGEKCVEQVFYENNIPFSTYDITLPTHGDLKDVFELVQTPDRQDIVQKAKTDSRHRTSGKYFLQANSTTAGSEVHEISKLFLRFPLPNTTHDLEKEDSDRIEDDGKSDDTRSAVESVVASPSELSESSTDTCTESVDSNDRDAQAEMIREHMLEKLQRTMRNESDPPRLRQRREGLTYRQKSKITKHDINIDKKLYRDATRPLRETVSQRFVHPLPAIPVDQSGNVQGTVNIYVFMIFKSLSSLQKNHEYSIFSK